MRLRRKAWARPELQACPFYIQDPPALRGRWHDAFPRRQPIVLELGCGKGNFIAHVACQNPDTNYIAIDIKSEVLALTKRSIEKRYLAAGRDIDNIFIMSFDVERIDLVLLPDDAVSAIYINFPNPWPKEGHKKHRLTHTRQLLKYREFLAPDGDLFFKTDDKDLYSDTITYLEQSGFDIAYMTDSYAGNGGATSEHEDMFRAKGLSIYYIHLIS